MKERDCGQTDYQLESGPRVQTGITAHRYVGSSQTQNNSRAPCLGGCSWFDGITLSLSLFLIMVGCKW